MARGGRILTCTYEGYPSWYGQINTKTAVDSDGAVAESDEGKQHIPQAHQREQTGGWIFASVWDGNNKCLQAIGVNCT